MAELSPAAQAILDAFFFNWADEPLGQDRQCLVAALRAMVQELKYVGITEKNILAIAAELDNANNTSEGDFDHD